MPSTLAEYGAFTNDGSNLTFNAPLSTVSQYAVSTVPAGPPGYLNNYFYIGETPPIRIHYCARCRFPPRGL